MIVVINPKFETLNHFITRLPQTFEHSGEIVYEARNQLKKYSVQGLEIIVKRYKIPHWVNRFAYSFIRLPKAVRAYEYALRLLDKGISSPDPIAYIIEKENGIITYSYFVSIFESKYRDIRSVMEGNETNDELIHSFGSYAAYLHSEGVLHHDLSPGNVLYQKTTAGYQFSLIDINRMEFPEKISFEKRCKSFNRLTPNQNILTKVATAYAQEANFDHSSTVDCILKYSNKYFNSYRVRSRK